PFDTIENLAEESYKIIESNHRNALIELEKFRHCSSYGMKFYMAEGDWYLRENTDFLIQVSSVLTGDLREFILFNGTEMKTRIAEDASLLISWDELRQRIIRWENFAKLHPDLEETKKEIEPQIPRMVQWYLTGIDNTRAYDYDDYYGGTAKINSELRKSYEIFIKENTGSSYYPLIQSVYTILLKHEFKCQRELGYFLINNGYRVYYWRDCLKNK
ncbi:MAG: hypothetical protein KAR20_28530, partial [Candidatus Heimdallarchaeota archaeon]|nr:hypothetical protein [Candidatus Heimdallarchaeota archaeon]